MYCTRGAMTTTNVGSLIELSVVAKLAAEELGLDIAGIAAAVADADIAAAGDIIAAVDDGIAVADASIATAADDTNADDQREEGELSDSGDEREIEVIDLCSEDKEDNECVEIPIEPRSPQPLIDLCDEDRSCSSGDNYSDDDSDYCVKDEYYKIAKAYVNMWFAHDDDEDRKEIHRAVKRRLIRVMLRKARGEGDDDDVSVIDDDDVSIITKKIKVV